MTLAPGESAHYELRLPPHLAAKMEAGALFSIIEGPIERVSWGNFKRNLDIYLDSNYEMRMSIRWRELEPWYLFLARRLGLCDRNKLGGPSLSGYQCEKVAGGSR